MRAFYQPFVMQRRLLGLTLALCSGLAQAAPEADKSLQDIPCLRSLPR